MAVGQYPLQAYFQMALDSPNPAIELRFATPTRAGRILTERLGLLLTIQLLSALSFRILALGADFTPLGSWLAVCNSILFPVLSLPAPVERSARPGSAARAGGPGSKDRLSFKLS